MLMDQPRELQPIPAYDGRRKNMQEFSAKIKEVLVIKKIDTLEHSSKTATGHTYVCEISRCYPSLNKTSNYFTQKRIMAEL